MGSWRDRRVLGVAVFSNFTQFGARVVISPFVLTIAAAFGASKGEIGAVLTVLWAVFASLQFPSGVFADRFGERRVILVSMSLTAVGSVAVALSPSLVGFVVAIVVLGVGTGLYFSVGSALVTRLYDDSGSALGLHSAGAPLAGLVFPAVGATVAVWTSWRVGVALGAVSAAAAVAAVTLLVGLMPAVSPDSHLTDRLSMRTLRAVFGRPSVAFTTLLASIGMYAFQALVSFFPAFLIEYHGLGDRTASFGFGLLFVFIIVGLPTFGRIGDRLGVDYGVAFPMATAALGLGLLLVGPTVVVLPATALLGFGVTWTGSLQARFIPLFEPDRRGTGFGLVRTAFVLLGSLGNVVTGVVADLWGWPAAFGLVVAILLCGITLVVGNRLEPNY